ncbi:MAG: hypothetical protein SWE60_05740 [Thermodesulfobacteriota bacterium]|nr:hypothetical protein [Thermodesulfobacteriota bacterium]
MRFVSLGLALRMAGRWAIERKCSAIVIALIIIWAAFAVLWISRNVAYKAVPLFQTFYGKTESERIRLVNPSLFSALDAIRKGTPEDAKILLVLRGAQADASNPAFGVKDQRWVYFRLKYYLVPRSIYLFDGAGRTTQDIVAACKRNGMGYYLIYSKGQKPLLKQVG